MSQKKEVRLAGAALGRSRHVCAFFHTKDEEYRVLLPFIKEGFEQARGFFRSRVARALQLRRVPELRFRHDTSARRAVELSQLIDEVRGTGPAPTDP